MDKPRMTIGTTDQSLIERCGEYMVRRLGTVSLAEPRLSQKVDWLRDARAAVFATHATVFALPFWVFARHF
jgi:hypothetical protein